MIMKNPLIWSTFGILMICLGWSVFLTIHWRKRARALEHENHLLMTQQANMEELMNEIRSERHDFIKHIQAIEHLSRQQENEILAQYLDELNSDIQRINATVRGEKGHMASLLIHIAEESNRSHVRVRYDLEVPLSSLPMGLIEQTKLAGNLLENALEAATKYAERHDQAYIEVYSSIRSGLYLLEVRNSTLPIPGEVLDQLFKHPVPSSKEIGSRRWMHGIGTYVIAETVKKHTGTLEFSYQPPWMSVKVKIPVLKEMSAKQRM